MKRNLALLCLALIGPFLGACASNTPAEWAERGDARLVRDSKFRMGYVQSRSDAVKSEYWRRQDLERLPGGAGGQEAERTGRTVYYTLPGPREAADGVILAPHPITVPVTE